MRNLITFIFTCFVACSCWIHNASAHPDANAQATDIVEFSDSKLARKIVAKTGATMVTNITVAHLRNLTSLNVSTTNDGEDTRSLEGLEHATNLETLVVRYQSIDMADGDALAPLANLTNLQTLQLDISLYDSNGDPVDISSLSRLTNLTTLDLPGCHIENLSPLSGLTNLTHLNLRQNQISSISSLSGLTNLTILNLSDNRISSVSPLSRLTSLTDLDLSNNQIVSLSSFQS